jgi:polysaccharide export outer membrane protein
MLLNFALLLYLSMDSISYRIEPGDVLEVVILGQEELSRDLLVMHNGNITFPLIGDIKVSGLTTNQVADTIATFLKRYFVQPLVSVILKGPSIATVAVYGEVIKPGTVQYQRGLRISDYVALAGGPSDRANLRRFFNEAVETVCNFFGAGAGDCPGPATPQGGYSHG